MTAPSFTATDLFNEGFNCCQSVLCSIPGRFDIPRQVLLKLAAPFGGGMGRMGEVCGAVAGALMAIGLTAGFSTPGDDEAKLATYQMVREFARRFRERNGSILCHELLGIRIDSPEGLQKVRDLGLIETKCAKYVRDAAELVGALLV